MNAGSGAGAPPAVVFAGAPPAAGPSPCGTSGEAPGETHAGGAHAPLRIIREFWHHIQARAWESAHALLAPDFTAIWPHTAERFVGRDNFIAMNREYPEGWTLRVLDVSGITSQIEVIHGDERYVAASFFTVRDERLAGVTEYWVQHGAEKPPEWRSKFSERLCGLANPPCNDNLRS